MIDVDVRDLRKQFLFKGKTQEVIDGLTFSVERGSLVAIIGPSGCGKSTLLRILSGAESKSSGTFDIVGDRAAHSASIEQSPALFPWRTALQNAHIGAEIRKARLRRACPDTTVDDAAVRKRIRESFESFDLQGFENHFPDQLSGGMAQRVAIIRALESEPKILFCDEPFSAIDFVTRLSLNTKFKKMSRNLGCTTIFVTHNIEEAIFLADRILVLSRRPCRIVDEFAPQLSRCPEDAVKCRQSPEFPAYFDRIWEKLKP
jgi:NitT/TauT family transport system ATP-binding protein